MLEFMIKTPNGVIGNCLLTPEEGARIAREAGYSLDNEPQTREEIEAYIQNKRQHLMDELRKSGEMPELLKKMEDIDRQLDKAKDQESDFFDDTDDSFTNTGEDGTTSSSGRDDSVWGIASGELDAAHIDFLKELISYDNEYEDIPCFEQLCRAFAKLGISEVNLASEIVKISTLPSIQFDALCLLDKEGQLYENIGVIVQSYTNDILQLDEVCTNEEEYLDVIFKLICYDKTFCLLNSLDETLIETCFASVNISNIDEHIIDTLIKNDKRALISKILLKLITKDSDK